MYISTNYAQLNYYYRNAKLKSVTSPQIVKKGDNSINFSNYGTNFVNSNYNFKGSPLNNIPKIVQKASLSEKLAAALNKIDTNNLLILCKDTETGIEGFKKITDQLAYPISKLVFLLVPGLAGCLAFEKDDTHRSIWNISEHPLVIDDQIIDPDYTALICDNSVLVNKDIEVDFSEQSNNLKKLEKFSKYFLEEYHFDDIYDETLEKHYQEVISILEGETDNTEKLKNKDFQPKPLDFSQIGGQDHIIESISKQVLYPLMYPEAFPNLQNKGVIFYGPPGTGKSLMAKAISETSGASFFKVTGSELDAKYVGETEENWRKLHQNAIDGQPSIIFIDEMEGVMKERSHSDVHGAKALTQILGLIDEDEKYNRQIFWIGATNKKDFLDSAIIRSGRFGKKFEFLPPKTKKDVEQIFNIHTKNMQLAEDLDKDKVFDLMLEKNMTGADIKMIVDDARFKSYDRNEIFKSMKDGTYNPLMLEYTNVNTADFINAVNDFNTTTEPQRKRIGFGN